MPEAYRSNTEGEEEKYQEALAQYRQRVEETQKLSWVYTRRKARRLAGVLTVLSLLVCYPVSFGFFVLALLLRPNPTLEILAWQWWPQGFALGLALFPIALYWVVYRLMLKREAKELRVIFEVPRRVASTTESTLFLQQQNPLQKLKDRCVKLGSGSISWSFAAIASFCTQLPMLCLLTVIAFIKREHPQAAAHCWIDASAELLFVSALNFIGFYPFVFSLWGAPRGTEDPDVTLLWLNGDHDGLKPSFTWAMLLSFASVAISARLNLPHLELLFKLPLVLVIFAAPMLVVVLLGGVFTRKFLRRTQAAYREELEAFY